MIKSALGYFAICLPLIALELIFRGPEAAVWSGGLLALFSLQLGFFTTDTWRSGEYKLWTFADQHRWFGVPFTLALGVLIVAGFVMCALILWGLGWDIARIIGWT